MFKRLFILIFVFAALFFADFTKNKLEGYLGKDFEKIEFKYLMPDYVIKLSSFGYEVAIGDLFWLKTLQNMDVDNQHVREFSYLYNILNTAATLIPNYRPIYVGGGGFLAVIYWDYKGAESLFHKGLKVFPNDPHLHSFLSMLYMMDLKDFEKSAYHMKMASKSPDTPSWYKNLAARLYVKAERPDIALTILTNLYKKEKNIKTKKELARKIKLVLIEKEIVRLKELKIEYEKKYGKLHSLNDLINKNLINSIPNDPFGGYYKIDKSGNIVSTTTQERYHPYMPKRGKRDGEN